jgi:hypothetical protein
MYANQKIRAALAAVLSACHSMAFLLDIPRALPHMVTVSKRRDGSPDVVIDHDDLHEHDHGAELPAPSAMPAARGITYALDEPSPYWLHDAAIRASVASRRNAALLMSAFRGG